MFFLSLLLNLQILFISPMTILYLFRDDHFFPLWYHTCEELSSQCVVVLE